MTTLPHNLYSAEQARELDRIAIEEFGISSNILMERAGEAAFNVLRESWPEAQRVAVVCGTGNNGGDGFVIARLASEQDFDIHIYQVGDATRLQGDALSAVQRLLGADVVPEAFGKHTLIEFDVVVDALLGTGLSGEVNDEHKKVIEAINASGVPVLAVDIPSGLNASTGAVCGVAVKASATVTFIGMKQGLLTGEAPDYCGKLVFNDLNVPEEVYAKLPTSVTHLDYARLKSLLSPRRRAAHKGDFGHVLIAGGDVGMAGAVRMAGEAALRSGAGRVSLATRHAHAGWLSGSRPELMSHGVEQEQEFKQLIEKATVIAIGPGLGRSEWAKQLMQLALASERPLVVDADALNLLASESVQRGRWILTPHPGEAGRLLASDSQAIQADRFPAVKAISEKYAAVTVLKGAGTLVCDEKAHIGVCSAGNAGMASAGVGDVLTGIIAGLLAQGLELLDAAQLGVCLHAEAGDDAVKAAGERGMLAGDLMPWIRRLANP